MSEILYRVAIGLGVFVAGITVIGLSGFVLLISGTFRDMLNFSADDGIDLESCFMAGMFFVICLVGLMVCYLVGGEIIGVMRRR